MHKKVPALAEITVFYSWQDDSPPRTNRYFIRDASERAIKTLRSHLELFDPVRLDSDTVGMSGLPAIGDAILGKIDNCAALIADVTFVGASTGSRHAKKMPNSNVLLELGYAAARIGWDRIILVMNEAYGPPEDLPFDLKHRRFPIRYNLCGYDLPAEISEASACRDSLAGNLAQALTAVLQNSHSGISALLKKLDLHCQHLMREHAGSSFFWQTEIKNTLSTTVETSIRRMLELGLCECVQSPNAPDGFGYAWTYFGRECLNRLGWIQAQQLPRSANDDDSRIVVDLSHYDFLGAQTRMTPDGGSSADKLVDEKPL